MYIQQVQVTSSVVSQYTRFIGARRCPAISAKMGSSARPWYMCGHGGDLHRFHSLRVNATAEVDASDLNKASQSRGFSYSSQYTDFISAVDTYVVEITADAKTGDFIQEELPQRVRRCTRRLPSIAQGLRSPLPTEGRGQVSRRE